jgi:hypothetical protein
LQGLAGTASQGLSYKGQMNMMDKQYQNDLGLLNAQNGVGGTKSAPNTNMLQGVNVGKQMMGSQGSLSMLSSLPPIGSMMKNQQGLNNMNLANQNINPGLVNQYLPINTSNSYTADLYRNLLYNE